MSFEEANYFVLGATGGIGSETCRRLRAAGARVMLGGRDASRLESLSEELGAPCCSLDARHCDEVERAVKQASEELGPLSGVVNCVGSVLLKPAHLTTVAEWEETLAVNLTSAFATVRAAAAAMKKQGGAIVLVSSAAGQTGLANHEAIAAAKAGVTGLMRSAAASYAARQIRVNAVAPGFTLTEMVQQMPEKILDGMKARTPLRRLGEPRDIANAYLFLASDEASFISGETLRVDGGIVVGT